MITEDNQEQMMMAALARVPVGFYNLNRGFTIVNQGWIEVERDSKQITHIWWRSHRDRHELLGNSPAICLSITPQGTLQAYYKTALSLHCKWWHSQSKDKEEYKEAMEQVEWLYDKLAQCKVIQKVAE